jgi:hypothetical protein
MFATEISLFHWRNTMDFSLFLTDLFDGVLGLFRALFEVFLGTSIF